MVYSEERIGRFLLQCEIGRGSYSTVWRALDPTLNREVAIKIPIQVYDSEKKDLFLKEAMRVAQLKHEGIVRVLEASIDEATSVPYIVLELIDGVTLREWVSFAQLSYQDKAKIVSDIAIAVHHAHLTGIIHRDLKPANILVSLDGKIHVADFGLAKAVGIDATSETSTMGTIAYMSPEQAHLHPDPVGVASDVYSIGVILFELLSGSNPIDATSPSDHLARLGAGRKLNLKAICQDLPEDLAVICQKCIEHHPCDRYSSALELSEELERFCCGEPIRSRELAHRERLVRFVRRNRRAVVSLSVPVLCIMFLLPTTFYFWNQRQRISRIESAVTNLVNCQPQAVSAALDEILAIGGEALPYLERSYDSAKKGKGHRAFFGVAVLNSASKQDLSKIIANAPNSEAENLILAMAIARSQTIGMLQAMYQELANQAPNGAQLTERAKLAVILAHVGDLSCVTEMAAIVADPIERTELLELWPNFHGSHTDFTQWLKQKLPPSLMSIVVITVAKAKDFRTPEIDPTFLNLIQDLTTQSPSAVVHSAGIWALKKIDADRPILREASKVNFGFAWAKLKDGLNMVLVESSDENNQSKFLISATEITNEQFLSYKPDHLDAIRKKYDVECPMSDAVRYISANEMVAFCNSLSDQYGLTKCYEHGDEHGESRWRLVDGATGFRLPYVWEWKEANLAKSESVYFFGEDDEKLELFANISLKTTRAPTMSFPPNGFGLFDTLGNVAEACHSGKDMKTVLFHGGGMAPSPSECRGKGVERPLDIKTIFFGFRVVCDSQLLTKQENLNGEKTARAGGNQ